MKAKCTATAKNQVKNTCNRTHFRFIYRIECEKDGERRVNKNTTSEKGEEKKKTNQQQTAEQTAELKHQIYNEK